MTRARGQAEQFLFLVFCWNKNWSTNIVQFITFIDRIDLIKFQGGGTVKMLLFLLWVYFEIVDSDIELYRTMCVCGYCTYSEY